MHPKTWELFNYHNIAFFYMYPFPLKWDGRRQLIIHEKKRYKLIPFIFAWVGVIGIVGNCSALGILLQEQLNPDLQLPLDSFAMQIFTLAGCSAATFNLWGCYRYACDAPIIHANVVRMESRIKQEFPTEYGIIEEKWRIMWEAMEWLSFALPFGGAYLPVPFAFFVAFLNVDPVIYLGELLLPYFGYPPTRWSIWFSFGFGVFRFGGVLLICEEITRMISFGTAFILLESRLVSNFVDTIILAQKSKTMASMKQYREVEVLYRFAKEGASWLACNNVFTSQIMITLCFTFAIKGWGKLPLLFYIFFPGMLGCICFLMAVWGLSATLMCLKTNWLIERWNKAEIYIHESGGRYGGGRTKQRSLLKSPSTIRIVKRMARALQPVEVYVGYFFKGQRSTPMTFVDVQLNNLATVAVLINF